MGHKVNPYGFRLGVIYPWKSNWYAGRDYADQLHEDVWIRKRTSHVTVVVESLEKVGEVSGGTQG